jgi:hypothetical protein
LAAFDVRLLEICPGVENRERLAEYFIGGAAGRALRAGVPDRDAATGVDQVDRVIDEQPDGHSTVA